MKSTDYKIKQLSRIIHIPEDAKPELTEDYE